MESFWKAASLLAFLCVLPALVLGVIALFSPRHLGFGNRTKSSLVLFGGAFVLLCFSVATSPSSKQSTEDPFSSSESFEARKNGTTEKKEPVERIYHSLPSLLSGFSSYTKLQQEKWDHDNQWKNWVEGSCTVSDVKRTSITSEIRDAAYEVVCELSNGDRAILFYPADAESTVTALSPGSYLSFQGNLKTIKDWALWRSGYIKVSN